MKFTSRIEQSRARLAVELWTVSGLSPDRAAGQLTRDNLPRPASDAAENPFGEINYQMNYHVNNRVIV